MKGHQASCKRRRPVVGTEDTTGATASKVPRQRTCGRATRHHRFEPILRLGGRLEPKEDQLGLLSKPSCSRPLELELNYGNSSVTRRATKNTNQSNLWALKTAHMFERNTNSHSSLMGFGEELNMSCSRDSQDTLTLGNVSRFCFACEESQAAMGLKRWKNSTLFAL